MYIHLRCAFEIALVTDMLVLLLDCEEGASIVSDVEAVVSVLSLELPGGIGHRRIYYRDRLGRFDEILVKNGSFRGFRAGSDGQQNYFWSLILGAEPSVKISGAVLSELDLSPRIPF